MGAKETGTGESWLVAAVSPNGKISNMPSQPHQLGKQLFIPASSHEVLIGGGVMKNSPFAAVFASPWSCIVEFTIAVDHSRVFPGLLK